MNKTAIDGILDLGDWDFNEDGIVALDGEWEFYWNELLVSNDLANNQDHKQLFQVPQVWNGQFVNNEPLSGQGYATYRLIIDLPTSHPLLALKTSTFSSAAFVFVNGVKVISNGVSGEDADSILPEYLASVANLQVDQTQLEIIIQVANFNHRKGGIWYSVNLGSQEQIGKYRDRIVLMDIFLFGSIIMMGFYYLGIYLARSKEKSAILFAGICLLLSFRGLFTGDYLISQFMDLSYDFIIRAEYFTFYFAVGLLALFFKVLFSEECSKLVIYLYVFISSILSIFLALAPPIVFTYTMIPFQILTVAGGFYLLFVLIVAIIRKRDGAKLFLIGFGVLVGTFINDALYSNNIIDTGYFGPFGLFLFILIQALTIFRRFTKAFKQNELLTLELESHNKSLEDKVSERTTELNSKNTVLQHLNQDLERFAITLSHDLKTPLRGIANTVNFIKADFPNLDEELKKMHEVIRERSTNAFEMVNGILAYTRAGEGNGEVENVDMKALLTSISKQFEDEFGAKLDLIGHFPNLIYNKFQVEQIFSNLIINAIKHGNQRENKVEVGYSSIEHYHEFRVTDNGPGVPKNQQSSIFKIFSKGENSSGSGVGLSIVDKLVRKNGGKIMLESETGKGATFKFTLPK